MTNKERLSYLENEICTILSSLSGFLYRAKKMLTANEMQWFNKEKIKKDLEYFKIDIDKIIIQCQAWLYEIDKDTGIGIGLKDIERAKALHRADTYRALSLSLLDCIDEMKGLL